MKWKSAALCGHVHVCVRRAGRADGQCRTNRKCVTVTGLKGNTMVRNNTLVTHPQGTVTGERERTMKMPGSISYQPSNNHVTVLPVDPTVTFCHTAEKPLASEVPLAGVLSQLFADCVGN